MPERLRTLRHCSIHKNIVPPARQPLLLFPQLFQIAYSIVGRPDAVQFEDKVVAVLEARDGTILDVVRQIKPYTFED